LLIDSVKNLHKEVVDLKKFKAEYSLKKLTEPFVDSHKTETSENPPIPKKKRKFSSKIPKKTDRKTHKGSTYKYCFLCEDWSLENNFTRCSTEADLLKPNCKKHGF